jgi:hypothetical protein
MLRNIWLRKYLPNPYRHGYARGHGASSTNLAGNRHADNPIHQRLQLAVAR